MVYYPALYLLSLKCFHCLLNKISSEEKQSLLADMQLTELLD